MSDEGFARIDLEIAEQLVRGGPERVEDLIEVGRRVLDYSQAIDVGHDNEAAARQLLAAVLRVATDELDEGTRPAPRLRERYLSYIARRAAGEPIGLILGHVEFCGLRLAISRGAFVPRPSAMLAVDRTLHHLGERASPIVVDLCTGVGPIALTVASKRPDASVWGIDISKRSLALARRNARDLGVDNAAFRMGDLYRGLPKRLRTSVDVIVGNIPFVHPSEVPTLPTEVSEYEPLFSLTDLSADGLALLRRAVGESGDWLQPGGWLLVELSEDSADGFAALCAAAGLEDVDVVSAPTSWDVMVEARRPL